MAGMTPAGYRRQTVKKSKKERSPVKKGEEIR